MNMIRKVELSGNDRLELEEIHKRGPTPKIARRAHAILLSHQGLSALKIAALVNATNATVYRWMDRWEESGFAGLHDNSRPGRPPIWNTERDQQVVSDVIKAEPRSSGKALIEIIRITGKSASLKTLRRTLKKKNLSWKRVRKSLRDKRDPKEFERGKRMVRRLLNRENRGEIDVFFLDEFSINLVPSVPYAWQPRGIRERIELPSSRSIGFNTIGMMNRANELHCIVLEGQTINTEVVVGFIDMFVEKRQAEGNKKPAHIIIDNAPVHSSNEFTKQLGRWRKAGVWIKRIPPYSPELNAIEILWRQIKYRWIPFEAYQSVEFMKFYLLELLASIGEGHQVNLSKFLAA